jgi:hypothetical protein
LLEKTHEMTVFIAFDTFSWYLCGTAVATSPFIHQALHPAHPAILDDLGWLGALDEEEFD